MLKWFNLSLVMLLVVLATLFAEANQFPVAIHIPGQLMVFQLPLYVVIFGGLVLGAVFGALLTWLGGLRERRQLQRLIRVNRDLEEELNNLRNLPLDKDILF